MRTLSAKEVGYRMVKDHYRSLISHLQYVRDTVTSQIIAGPVKTNEHKHNEHENIDNVIKRDRRVCIPCDKLLQLTHFSHFDRS